MGEQGRNVQAGIGIFAIRALGGLDKALKGYIVRYAMLGFPRLRRMILGRSRRPVLVIVRAGDDSLHRGWLKGGPDLIRNWDLHISYYGDRADPFPDLPPDVTLSREKGSKSVGNVECLTKLGDRIDAYRFIWLPDDDIECDLPTLNRFFEIVRHNKFALAQPALGPGSFVAHDITRQRPQFRWRYTSFVEIMCPCFSREAFALCRGHLGATKSSWGVDLLFPKLLGYPRRKIAIVDETPVIHTRPPSSGGQYPSLLAAGIDPKQETLDVLREYGFPESTVWPYFSLLETYAAVDKCGRLITELRGAQTSASAS